MLRANHPTLMRTCRLNRRKQNVHQFLKHYTQNAQLLHVSSCVRWSGGLHLPRVYSILSSQGIEQLKKEERRWAKKSKWMNMKVVFGHPFSIAWLSPFTAPDHGKADVYQYIVWQMETLHSVLVCPLIGWTTVSMNSSSNYSFSSCTIFQGVLL